MIERLEIKSGTQKTISSEEMMNTIKKMTSDSYEIYIGSDSQTIKDHVSFVTCLCLYKQGSGGIFFYLKEKIDKKKYPNNKLRLLDEVYRSLELASDINTPSDKIKIHLDLNKEKSSAFSFKFSKEFEGIVKACGYECALKPEGWATFLADRFTKS